MLVCHGCQRHVRVHESRCPFCETSIRTTTAPAPLVLGAMALVAGFGLGCAVTGDDSPDDEIEQSAADYGGPEDWEEQSGDGDGDGDGETGETGDGDGDGETGDGDGDGETGDGDGDGDGDDEGGADYGGAPPPPQNPNTAL